jgi:hypothetical protein
MRRPCERATSQRIAALLVPSGRPRRYHSRLLLRLRNNRESKRIGAFGDLPQSDQRVPLGMGCQGLRRPLLRCRHRPPRRPHRTRRHPRRSRSSLARANRGLIRWIGVSNYLFCALPLPPRSCYGGGSDHVQEELTLIFEIPWLIDGFAALEAVVTGIGDGSIARIETPPRFRRTKGGILERHRRTLRFGVQCMPNFF